MLVRASFLFGRRRLSFSHPAFLWIAAAIPLVVLLHLIPPRRLPMRVGFLGVWAQAIARAGRRRRWARVASVFSLVASVCAVGFAALTLAAIGAFIIHDTAVGAGAGIASLPLVSWAIGEPFPITLGFLVIFLIIFIRRLTVRQTSVTVSVSRGQLFINRLIFDRDIRDREAWLRRKPLTGTPGGQPSGLRKHRG